ncbi:N-acetylmuramoyl-L-alanine amidase [Rufibacter glacialis]|uniref:N-acetylmuramoyl-L-alanine amidase n=1 Tax=Rufibacter glacialis TaxID=1259555 RepID=A0A5M8QQW6_9BACT|nr:N-acetylmuramoyl-L-alanine amidase [Rufibacter glacialis]KAA6437394.1 N-acetylmuramoyl-L-alanine amidase [Rufibacter glacialis]GGK59638.1 N-acetylmuramoyl-L-alanine amidase [Rufibacter glacialis]
MKPFRLQLALPFLLSLSLAACSPHPYATTNREYKKKAKAFAKTLQATPVTTPGQDSLQMGDQWVGTVNFNLRKPNYVVIHHTAQNSTEQTLKTFTVTRTQVSAHYVIGRDGKVYHMLSDYLRAWHGGSGRWGNNTDLNSSSIGIELDNNGAEPFAEEQINSLLQVLAILKKTHGIPAANFIGHSDIAPSRKVDPNPTFPWKKLAEAGYGIWYDEEAVRNSVFETVIPPYQDSAAVDSAAVPVPILPAPATVVAVDTIPASFQPKDALRIIGYDVKNLDAAIKAFKLHFIQKEVNGVLTDEDKKVLYHLYKKSL